MTELTRSTLKLAASTLAKRTKYFGCVLWYFVHATKREGAVECIRQVRATDLANHDPLTRRIWRDLEADLVAVSDGFAPSDALLAEVASLERCPLDESCGEGWHRTATHEKQRASASSVLHLKMNARLKQVIRTCRSLISRHKGKAKDMLRFEWFNFKRVLQTKKRHLWRGVNMKRRAFYLRLYRQDSKSRESWASIAVRVKEDHIETEQLDNTGQLQREYMNQAFAIGHYYSVPCPRPELVDNGTSRLLPETTYFQIVNKQDGRARDKIAHLGVA